MAWTRFRLLVAAFVTLSTAALAVAQDARAVVRADTFVRNRPVATAATLVSLSQGSEVTVLRVEGAWRFVRTSAGVEGYVHESFLDGAGAAAPSQPTASPAPSPSPGAEAEPSSSSRAPEAADVFSSGYAFVDYGLFRPSASDAFQASFEKSQAFPVGLGVGLRVDRWFADVALRFSKVEGYGQSIDIRPISFTAGWRASAGTLRPYVGAGPDIYIARQGPTDPEIVETFAGFHVLGGVMYRLSPRFFLGGEGEISRVKNTLDPLGTRYFLEENSLGGLSLRVKATLPLF